MDRDQWTDLPLFPLPADCRVEVPPERFQRLLEPLLKVPGSEHVAVAQHTQKSFRVVWVYGYLHSKLGDDGLGIKGDEWRPELRSGALGVYTDDGAVARQADVIGDEDLPVGRSRDGRGVDSSREDA